MENDRPFTIICSGEEVYLQYKNNSVNKLISINIINNNIKFENPENLQKKVIYKMYYSNAILGIINIRDIEYVLFVTSSDVVGKMKNETIYRISEVEFCEIPGGQVRLNDEEQIKQIKDGISKLLKLGFYYSFGLDLTNSQQNQAKILYNMKIKNSNLNNNLEEKKKRIYMTSYKKYFFNYNLYKRFLNNETKEPIDYSFITPIICGYIGMFNYEISNKQIQIILITRRSQKFAGTRYNTRGINDDGNVANYCESEHILIAGDTLCSFSQLRGSAPVFFDQVGLRAYTDITRNKNLTKLAFSKHLKEMNEDYPLIYFINLLNQKKSIEAPIIAEFEKQIKLIQDNNNIRYTFFDMQNECPKDNYSRIDILINKITPVAEVFNFFSQNLNTNQINSIQKGTARTNCLDNLDRTNVIQTRISWLILENMFKFLKFDNSEIKLIFNNQENFFSLGNNHFKEIFKDLWAENGDKISIQYAGTASTITTVTKTGGHGLMGLINHGIATVSRLYQGNFEDKFKQECIDILLQKDIPEHYNSNPEINYALLNRKKEYTEFNDFYLFIGTYNLSGKNIDNAIDLVTWLLSYKDNPLNSQNNLNNICPEFYILGFQEIVDLNSANLLIKSNTDKKDKLKTLINNLLLTTVQDQNNDSYQLMKELDLVGLYVLIFVKSSCINYIKNFDYQIIKTGLKGTFGNKGSILLRFNLNDSTIALSCNHLSSGQEKNEERKTEIMNVLNTSFKKYSSLKFKEYDYFFYFGDLNTRLDLSLNDQLLIDLIKNHSKDTNTEFSSLAQYDQFNKYKNENILISELDEAVIRFSPTYKYIIGETNYDFNKRIPSWCDRIFYKKYSNTTPLAYNKCLLTISDHQPVYGVYKIQAEAINQQQKQMILNQIIKEKNMKNNNQNNNNNQNLNNFGNNGGQLFNQNDFVENFFG